jgi:DNA adenine methylase
MIELGTHDNSPLRYPGSKARRAVRLLRFADQSKRDFVEPFAGGLGTLIRARKERLYKNFWGNDADPQVTNFWTVLRDFPESLIDRLWQCYNKHGYGDRELFIKSKEDLISGDEITKATAFFIINRWSVRGDLRSKMLNTKKNRDGISPNMIMRLSLFSELLEGVQLTNLDYRDIDIPKNAFCFIDPPYENRKYSFNYQYRLDWKEFKDWIEQLHCSWLVTLNDSSITNTLFSNHDRIVYEYQRNFPVVLHSQYDTLGREKRTEIIIMNYHRSTRDAFIRQFGWSVRKAGIS